MDEATDQGADDDADDEDCVSEERQRRAEVLLFAMREIRLTWERDHTAALWYLQRTDVEHWGALCRRCSPNRAAPELFKIRTERARDAARVLETTAPEEWKPRCRCCGKIIGRAGL
jgi:hypothetical protein